MSEQRHTVDIDALAAVIREHVPMVLRDGMAGCGCRQWDATDPTYPRHAEHVAAALVASGARVIPPGEGRS